MAHTHQHVTFTELCAINPYYSQLLITKISDEGVGLEEPCVASISQNKQLLTNFPPNKRQSTNKQKKSFTCHTQVRNQPVVIVESAVGNIHEYLSFLSPH